MKKKVSKTSVAIVGGGVMGSVLLGIISKNGLAGKVIVCERDATKRSKLKRAFPKAVMSADFSEVFGVDVVLLAVKPQDFHAADLKISKSALVISIMAGMPVAAIRKRTGAAKIIRAMPNTPAQLGLGFTAWTATTGVDRKQRAFAQSLFSAMGSELYVRSEDEINKFTAITGSGPAYFFYSALSLMNAATALGVPTADAETAARKTLEGAAALLSSGGGIFERISQVASKGGTTEAALAAFKKAGFEASWAKAVRAAYNRAKELEKGK